MRNHRRTALPALAALAVFLGSTDLPVLAAPEKAAAARKRGMSGSRACAACHEEAVTAFRESIHGQKGFEMRSAMPAKRATDLARPM